MQKWLSALVAAGCVGLTGSMTINVNVAPVVVIATAPVPQTAPTPAQPTTPQRSGSRDAKTHPAPPKHHAAQKSCP
jgi:hypothetical protein